MSGAAFAAATRWKERGLELWRGLRARAGKAQGFLASRPGRWLGVGLFFSVAAVVQTWPLVLHATDSLQDSSIFPFDTYAFIWNLWWVKHAIVDLRTNLFHTDLLFYPEGTDLYLHTLPVINGVLSIPLQVATGNLFLSWNVLALLFFVFSGLAIYALSYRVNGSHLGGMVSAYVFAFAPYVLMQFNSRWHISTTWPIPLFALFLVRFQEKFRMREAVAAGILWAVLTYNNLEYALDASVFLGLLAAYWGAVYLRRGDRDGLLALARGLVVVAAVWFVVSSPLLIPTLRAVQSGEYHMPGGDEFYSADLLAFVTPSPLWGPGEDPAIGGFGVHPHQEIGTMENTLYLGIVPLLLAALATLVAIRRRRPGVLFWCVVFLAFTILTLGPWLYVDGTKSFSVLGVSVSVPLPYQLYDQIPVIGERRVPTRMLVFGMMGLAVLAGAGTELLTSWLGKHRKAVASLAGLLILALVALEFWNPPVHLTELPRPAILQQIGDEPGDFSVLHAPWGRMTGWGINGDFFGGPFASYYQTVHEKATFGGFVSRAKESDLEWVGREPGLRYLACPVICEDLPAAEDLDPAKVQEVFRRYRIRYVVLHRLTPHGLLTQNDAATLQRLDRYLREVVGSVAVYTDASFTVYRNADIQ